MQSGKNLALWFLKEESLCAVFYVKCWAKSQSLLGGRVLEPPGGSASICSRVAVGSGALALPCSSPEVLQAQEGCCPRLQSAPWSSLPQALERVGGQREGARWTEMEGNGLWRCSERGYTGQRWKEVGFGDAVRGAHRTLR